MYLLKHAYVLHATFLYYFQFINTYSSFKFIRYLHALHFSTIACKRGDVIVGLLGDWEGCVRLEASEWCDHAGLSRGNPFNGGDDSGGKHWGSHFFLSFSFAKLLLSLPIYNGINWIVHILWSQIDGLNFKQNLTIGSYTWWHCTIMATWKRKCFWI